MSAVHHATRGEVFLAGQSLGRAYLALCDVFESTERRARGAISFANPIEHPLIGRRLTVLPQDRCSQFEIVVTGNHGGCIAIASCGGLPWWK